MFESDNKEQQGFASPFEPPRAEQAEEPQAEQGQAGEPQAELLQGEALQAQTDQETPAYAKPAFGEEPYTQQAYADQPYTQQPYAGQSYTQQGNAQAYTQQSYSDQPYVQPSYAEQPYTQGMAPEQLPYADQPYTQAAHAQPPYGQPYAQPEQQPHGPSPYAQPEQQPHGPSPYEQFAQAQSGQAEPGPKRKKERKRREGPGGLGIGRKNTALLIVIIIIACAGSGFGGGMIALSMNEAPDVITVGGDPMFTIAPNDNITTTEAVAKKVLASVVGITATGRVITDYGFFGEGESEISGVGTGMILDARGYILTNSHVVLDGAADMIEVHLSSGEEIEGKVLWNDSGLDLAIVKIAATGLSPIELGDSDEVLIGSYAAAVGNPLGLEFSGSITQGVVSGLDRTITVAGAFGGGATTMQGLIQVDAAINSGNSGGPLLNSMGQVIGINTAKAQAEGMGFAIPINTAIPIVEKVLRDGSFERVFMGVSAADVQVIRDNYPNVVLHAERGACITDVIPGSPAEKGGLKVKDVITSIDGKEVSGSDSLIKMLLNYVSGDTITVAFDRDGETLETEVTLISQSELEQAQQEENPFRAPERGNAGR